MPDDKTLAEADAVARRDRTVDAYSTLIGPIAGRLARQLGASTTKEDLQQAGALGLLDAAARFESYARQRIEGAMRDSIRKRDWRETAHARHEDVAPMPDPAGDLMEVVLLSELYAAIEAELTPRQAQVIELALLGHTGTEIARELGVRQQTVVVLHNRAITRLRGRLAA